jgi:hypothetical protein
VSTKPFRLTFCHLDGDRDLDLVTGGVEPSVHCYENMGNNRLVDRGRLTSAGTLLTLPKRSRLERANGDAAGTSIAD